MPPDFSKRMAYIGDRDQEEIVSVTWSWGPRPSLNTTHSNFIDWTLDRYFHVAEQLWLSLDRLPQLVPCPLFGMHFLLLFTLLIFQAVSNLPSPFSKPLSSHRELHTGSPLEWFTLREALYIQYNSMHYNTIQYNKLQSNLIIGHGQSGSCLVVPMLSHCKR